MKGEMWRLALDLSYDEEPMTDINPDKLDVRVASGLFAGSREWNEAGKIVAVGKSAYDPNKRYLPVKEPRS